ncbi:MAG: hypothetical protein A2X45_08410 [Lentisphaerae bacterium GWF2_50_93]|nr:MAG: hypothetical protein A2X45_08410 [Lentisphaerae bacterium GWF2_50_93]
MQFHVYILYSQTLDNFYIGMSKFTAKRLRQHKKGQSHWTSAVDDWQEVWKTGMENSLDARELEKKIKSRGARRFLQDSGVAVPPEAG